MGERDNYLEIDAIDENVEELSFNIHNFRHLRWLVGFYQDKNKQLLEDNRNMRAGVLGLLILYLIIYVITLIILI